MSDNLKVWNAIKQPPTDALKQIKGGRLSGMTDVSPMFRYKAMTEQFGMVGVGWRFTIEKLWIEDGTEGQKMAFASVLLYFKDGEKWSEPIPGIGGSMLIAKEKSGLHDSDEAYKMAVTDALSTSTKMLGMAADIYAGKWDGTKYADEPEVLEYITTDQEIELNDLLSSTKSDLTGFLKYFKVDQVHHLPASKYKTALAMLNKKKEGK